MEELFTKHILDRSLAVPLYYQLYTYIEDFIKNGKLKEGDRLPSEEEMVSFLGISRPTVRQAYQALENKGYVKRQRSKGTIVTKPKVFRKFLTELTTFRDELCSEGTVDTKVLAFEVIHNFEAEQMLQVKKQIHLVRLRSSNGIPVVYLETYLPYDICKEVLLYDMEKDSLYETLHKIGRGVKSVTRHLRAIRASECVANYLEMEPGDPVMLSRTVGYDQNENPLEYSIASYNGIYADFKIQLNL